MLSAKKRHADDCNGLTATINVAKPAQDVQVNHTLQKMAAVANTSPLKVMQEYCSLAFGPGRVSFKDYTRLRLFDPDFYVDKRAVVGQRRNSDIDLTINYRHDWIGLFANKVASSSYLAAHGFATIPFLSVYADKLSTDSPSVIRDRAGLQAFLRCPERYPVFGKPVEGIQSFGSIGIRRYIGGRDALETMNGDEISLEHYVSDILTHYPDGYLFQKYLSPHSTIRQMCGDRLSTVRIVTLAQEGEPNILGACWKIPVGNNMADNYWRSGNLLAGIDALSGRVLRVMSGSGLELENHSVHPDTQRPLIGTIIPHWSQLIRLALDAARLMRHMPLIGFDMAVLEAGPVIVEMNHNPDFFLNQIADRRGVLDPNFLQFIAHQKRKAYERSKAIKREALQL